MAIGAGWADGAWVDAGWVVGAWQAESAVNVGGTSQLGALSSTGGITIERTLGGTSQLGAISSTGALTLERTLGGTSQLGAITSSGGIQVGEVVAAAGCRSSKARRLYIVEVDGNFIPVNSIAEAQSVLQQIRDLAEQSAQQDVKTEAPPAIPKIRVRTAKGKVTTSAPLQKAIQKTQSAVTKAYNRRAKQIAQDHEISVLLIRKIAQEEAEDDEAAAVLLLM